MNYRLVSFIERKKENIQVHDTKAP